MHSQNAIYNASCHKTLRNEASVCEKNKQAGINAKEQSLEYLNQHAESIALSEIVIEIEGEGNFTDKIFALAYLFKMYQERVKSLVNGDASCNRTKFKNRILNMTPLIKDKAERLKRFFDHIRMILLTKNHRMT